LRVEYFSCPDMGCPRRIRGGEGMGRLAAGEDQREARQVKIKVRMSSRVGDEGPRWAGA